MLTMLQSSGSCSIQCKVLSEFLSMPQLKEHIEKLNIQNKYYELKSKSFDNLAKMISHTSVKKGGNTEANKKRNSNKYHYIYC